MSLRFYNYRCDHCHKVRESLEVIGTNQITCLHGCPNKVMKRVTTNIPRHVKIDIEAAHFVPDHVKRARSVGHGGSTPKSVGRYDNDDPKTYVKKRG